MKVCLPEWHIQDAILIAWPHESTDWQPYLEQANQCYIQLATVISAYQPCLILCQDESHQTAIENQLANSANPDNCYYMQVPYNDTWTRDYGAISCLNNQQLELMDFQFNAWGDKFAANLDNQVNQQLEAQALWKAPLSQSELTLEGGSIETDGQGTLLATYHCIKQRYPKQSQEEIEQALSDALGFSHFLWLHHGHLAGDDTDAHIDTLARFVNETTIAYVGCDDQEDEHYPALKRMEEQLQAFRRPNGAAYTLVKLPFPEPQYAQDGHRLPATYANFLILNDAVLMPSYNLPQDKQARSILQSVFSRPVIAIDCRILIEQHGSLHCATMQLAQGSINFPSK